MNKIIAVFPLAAVLLLLCRAAEAQLISPLGQLSGLSASAASATSATPNSGAASAPVVVDGATLFNVYGRSHTDAVDRADLVTLRLEKILAGVKPNQPPTDISARSVDDQICILVNGTQLISITPEDASATGETVAALGAQWSDQIGHKIGAVRRERGPGFLKRQDERAAWVVGVALLINLLLWLVTRRLLGRPGWVSQAFVWLIAAHIITDLYPQTKSLHDMVDAGVLRPFAICIITALGASLASRLLHLVLDYVFPPLPASLSPEERTERTLRRRATLGTVARITGVTVIWIIAALVALDWIGVNPATFLTSAGLLGVVAGLAAQDTMKDIVAGVNILVDDRFGVGDIIEVGSFTGTVEKLNLRVTQIRDTEGRLITFPNRHIEQVANHTASWSQVDFRVSLSYNSDLRATMALLVDVANKLRDDFPQHILTDPQMLGVDSYNASDISVRMMIRTAPGDQWMIARELRLRIKEAFDAEGIEIPYPQSVVHHNTIPPQVGLEVADPGES